MGIGTPDYMAPEEALGEKVGPATDIYALGIVFYELVTGHRPFQADTPMAVLLKHLQDPLPRPQTFVPNLPDEVEQVLFKALAKQPDDRYAIGGRIRRRAGQDRRRPAAERPRGAARRRGAPPALLWAVTAR